MRAVVVNSFDGPLLVADVEPLPPRPDEVRVDVRASGVCHSDLSARRGMYPFVLPMVLGHEGTGVVAEVGSDVTGLAIGDRVIASWVPSCGHCYQCIRGRSHLCELQPTVGPVPHSKLDGRTVSAMSGLGTMAESMTVNHANLVKIDTTLSDTHLALIGCTVTTGVGAALWTAGVEVGSTVAIFGCGGVGLSIVQGAVIAGAAEIFVVDPVPTKRDAALRSGATVAVDPSAGAAVDEIRRRTSGRGAEFTFDAVGLVATMHDAYLAACNGGIVTYVGALPASAEISFPANALRASGKQVRGSTYGSAQVLRDMPRIAKLAESGRLDLDSMISRQLGLEDVEDAFGAMESGLSIRSVLVP